MNFYSRILWSMLFCVSMSYSMEQDTQYPDQNEDEDYNYLMELSPEARARLSEYYSQLKRMHHQQTDEDYSRKRKKRYEEGSYGVRPVYQTPMVQRGS